MRATNLAGHSSTCEEVLIVVISDKPQSPASGPTSIADVTSTDRIAIEFDEPDTGGSPITNFEIQMDDGVGGGFETVAGGELDLYKRTTLKVQNLIGIVALNSYDTETDSFSKEIVRG